MKKLILFLTFVSLGLVLLSPASSWAERWEDSPYNWNNSPNNWENSPGNWKNSPNNWKNSPNNWNRNNGIYGNSGSWGYITPKAGGGFNIFDDSGNRIGYVSGGR